MNDELQCPHCVVSQFIEANMPEDRYDSSDLIRGMIEVALDMLASADPRFREALIVMANFKLAEGIRDIHHGCYKTDSKFWTNSK